METLSAISRMVLRHLKDSYESQKILRYGATTQEGPGREEIIEERTAQTDARAVGGRRATADFSEGEIIEPEEEFPEAEKGKGTTRDHLGVMGEYEESRVESSGELAPAAEEEIKIEIEEPEAAEIRPSGPEGEEFAVDLVLGGEVERTGPSSFKIPLTFRVHDIKKDVVLTINLQLTDSHRERDIF